MEFIEISKEIGKIIRKTGKSEKTNSEFFNGIYYLLYLECATSVGNKKHWKSYQKNWKILVVQ